jgi:hypothetical protein
VAGATRRVLVEQARRKHRHRYGDGWRRVSLGDVPAIARSPDDLLALDGVLTKLAVEDPAAANQAKLRF